MYIHLLIVPHTGGSFRKSIYGVKSTHTLTLSEGEKMKVSEVFGYIGLCTVTLLFTTGWLAVASETSDVEAILDRFKYKLYHSRLL